MNKLTNYPIVLLLALLLTSCGDPEEITLTEMEECEELGNLGIYFLLEESKDFISYSENAEKIIFSDSSGKEYTGNITHNSLAIANHVSSDEPCPINEEFVISYNFRSEQERVTIEIEELDLRVHAMTTVQIRSDYQASNPAHDLFTILLQDGDNSTIGGFQTKVKVRNEDLNLGSPSPEILESLAYQGSTFDNVYSNENFTEGDYIIYYNQELGLVGLESKLDPSIAIKYVRTE